jgi:hypothetical protein
MMMLHLEGTTRRMHLILFTKKAALLLSNVLPPYILCKQGNSKGSFDENPPHNPDLAPCGFHS